MDIDLSSAQPALLVLDLQELFSSAEGAFENTGANELITNVNAFVEECEKLELPIIYFEMILATRDCWQITPGKGRGFLCKLRMDATRSSSVRERGKNRSETIQARCALK